MKAGTIDMQEAFKRTIDGQNNVGRIEGKEKTPFTYVGGRIQRPWRDLKTHEEVSLGLNSSRKEVERTSLVGLQGKLLMGLDVLSLHPLDLGGEDGLCRGGGVDTGGLDGDDDVSTVLQEVVGVKGDDTSLIGLGNIGKDDVDHGEKHSVLVC